MATVYRGTDRVLRRDVAIKVMHPHLAGKADARARFNREAQSIARLKHPNIVDVYDFSLGTDDDAYLITEFVHGETLTVFTNAHGPFLPQAVALVGHAVAGALGHAHTSGLVHRDIKPDNLMISRDGQIKLMDFGIATAMDMEQMTTTGAIVGSPAHMAPEQIEGGPLDQRCDVFAFGTVLYFLVTRRLPFVASNPQALFRLILEGHFDLPSRHNPVVDRHFDAIVAQCLSRSPVDRYPNMAAVQTALTTYLKLFRMSDTTGLLTRFLQAPEVFQFDLKPTIVAVLTAEGQKQARAGKLAVAIDTLNRALALDPDADEPKKALQQWTRRARRMRQVRRFGLGTAAAVVVTGLGVGAWWWQNLPDSPAPVVAPVPPAEGALIGLPSGPQSIRRMGGLAMLPTVPTPTTTANALQVPANPVQLPRELADASRRRGSERPWPRPQLRPDGNKTATTPVETPVVTPPTPRAQVSWRIGAIPPNSTLFLDNQPNPVGEGYVTLTLDAGSHHTVRCEPGPKCEGCRPASVRFTVPETPTPGKSTMTKCDVRPLEPKPETAQP